MKRTASSEDDMAEEQKPSQRPRLDPGGTSAHEATADEQEGNQAATEAEEKQEEEHHKETESEAKLSGEAEAETEDDDDVVVVKVEQKDEEDEVDEERPSLAAKGATTEAASTAPAAAAKKEEQQEADPEAQISYPKPKNFAERMMNALERGIASESVWWVGGGKAIALHPKNLKASPDLTNYFKAKDYSGFIRNCNRWGFRRVAHYSVPPGIVTYENSLFQKDQTHLVKHMRMDSDVQDVFARHQQSGSKPGETEAEKASRIIAEARALKGPSRINRKSRSSDSTKAATDEAPPKDHETEQLLQKAAGLAAAAAASGPAPASSGVLDESTISKEFMLRKILQLTDQFLEHPGALYSDDGSFRTTMQLVRALGQQHQQELLSKGQLLPLLRLEASLQEKPPGGGAASLPPDILAAQRAASGAAAQGPVPSVGGGMGGMDHLSQRFMGRPGPFPPAPGIDPLEALLLRNRLNAQEQVRQHHLAPQHHQLGQAAVGANAGTLMDRLLLQQRVHPQQGFAAATQAAQQHQGVPPTVSVPQKADVTGAAAQYHHPEAAHTEAKQDPEREDDAASDSSPQFTTAQELLLRVMSQNKTSGRSK